MAVNDFTGKNIQDTYQRVVQTDGTKLANGTGSLLPISFEGNDVIVSGALRAQSYIVSESIVNVSSGSTVFGNSTDDIHQFIGNISASNISSSGDINFTGTSGGIRLNGSGGFIIQSGQIVANQDIRTADGKGIKFGVDSDYTIQHAGTGVDVARLTIKEGSTTRYTFGVGGHLTASSGVNIELGQGGEFRGNSANITNITASNNISASGDVIAPEFHVKNIAGAGGYFIDTLGSKPAMFHSTSNELVLGGPHPSYLGAGIKLHTTGSDTTKGLFLDSVGNITASGIISASDAILASSFSADDTGGFRFKSDNVRLLADTTGDNLQIFGGGLNAEGNITASDNISASGNIIVNEITSSGNTKITGELELGNGNIRSDNNFDFLQLGGSAQQINIGKLGMSASYSAASTALSAMATSNAAVFGGDVSIGPSNNGKLGIGMLKPTSSLDITGDLRVSSHLTASGNISGSLNGTVSAGSGSFHILKGDESQPTGLLVEGTITAIGSISSSGNISSSGGTVTAKQLTLDHASRVDIKFSNDGDEDHYIRKDGNFLRFRGHDDSTVLLELRNNTDGSNKTSFPNGNHGIGTNDPGEKLEVVGNISASGTIFANQIETDQLVSHIGDANTGLQFASDTVQIQGNDEPIATFKSTLINFTENLNSTHYISGSSLISDSHITASGNISSSGTVFTANIAAPDNTNTSGNHTGTPITIKSGRGNGSSATAGALFLRTSQGMGTGTGGNITIQPGGGGTAAVLSGSINFNSPLINVNGAITASGDISASLNSKIFASSASFGGASFLRSFNVKGAGLDGRLSLQGAAGTDNPGIEFTVNDNTSRALIRLDQVGTNGTALEFFTEPDGGDITNTLTIGHTGHITASGNISSSGQVIANEFILNTNTNAIQFKASNGTLFSNILTNASDDFIVQNLKNGENLRLRAGQSGNKGKVLIQQGGTSTNIAEFGPTDSIHFTGNITASGNISSSGTLIVQKNQFSKTSNTDADHQGDVVFFGATTSMTAGKIYYYNSSGNWAETDADAEASAKGLLAVALGTASDTNGMLLRGTVTLDHDPGGVGDVLYLSTTAGQASSTVPSGNGDIVRVIGYCLDASNGQIWFNPDNTFVEVSA